MSPVIISLSDIRLTLPSLGGDVEILRGVSLSLAAQESVAIVGPSGSGKTSILMICAGLLKPNGGNIIYEGRDITALDEDDLAIWRRDNLGIVFQNFHLIPTMTALENVAIPLELVGLPDAKIRAEAALSSVNLSHRLKHYPAQLSGGEQQRVALARALSMKPKLILADEPTGNLDQETGRSIMSLLFDRVREEGATLALITHDSDLANLCNRKIHVKDGIVS